jgi:hypothetical protein
MILDYVHHQFETICWHMIHLHPKQKKMGERYGLTLTSSESFFLVMKKLNAPHGTWINSMNLQIAMV